MRIGRDVQLFLDRLKAVFQRPLEPAELLGVFEHCSVADRLLWMELLEYVATASLRSGDQATYISSLERMTQISPDALSYVALGNGLLENADPRGASRAFDKALEIAFEEGRLVRYATQAKLRSCVRLKDVDGANDAVRRLISFMQTKVLVLEDSPLELDMLESLRALGMDDNLLDQLRSLDA